MQGRQSGRESRGRRWGWVLLGGLVGLTVARILLALQDGVSSAEAYFWLLGEQWQWANFSGPGGVPALVAGLSAWVGPHPEMLGVISPLAILLASGGLWWLARSSVGPILAFWVVAAWNVLPGVQDVALTFGAEALLWCCWMWFLALAWRAWQDRRHGFFWWGMAGMVGAVGAFISYVFLLAPLGVVIFWVVEWPCWRRWAGRLRRRWPRWLRWPGRRRQSSFSAGERGMDDGGAVGSAGGILHGAQRVKLGAGWGLVLLLPALALVGPILWHVETNWVAFAGATWQSLTQFGGASPLLVAFLDAASRGGWGIFGVVLFFWGLLGQQAFSSPVARWWLAVSVLPGVGFFWELWTGQTAQTEPNGLIAGGFFLLVAPGILVGGLECLRLVTARRRLGHSLAEASDDAPRSAIGSEDHGEKGTWAAGSKVSIPGRWRWILAGALVGTAGWSAWWSAQPQELVEPDWAALSARLERVAHMFQPAGEEPLFLVAGEADAAAGLGFYLLRRETGPRQDFPPVFLKESQNLANQFGLWPRYDEFIQQNAPVVDDQEPFTEQDGVNFYLGRSAIYFGAEAPRDLPQVISNGFVQVIPLERIRDASGRVFYVYLCRDYQTAPL